MARPVSRRVFLRRAAGRLGVGLAAPYFLTGRAIAAPGRPGANDRIGLGHIGVGIQGTYHVRNYSRNEAFAILAVCDVNQKMRADAARLVGGQCAQYNDFRRVLDRKDIDAVLIASPEHWHALQAILACQAGKDVYCEKPMSHTVREGQAMVRAVRRHHRVFQTGAMQRSSNEFLRCCRLVRSGRIGRVKAVYVRVGGTSQPRVLAAEPVPPGLDWDLWLGPAPWRPYNRGITPGRGWFGIRDFSGGGMCDWGAHHFDIAQWGLGTDGTGPVEIHPPTNGRYTFKYASGVVMQSGNVPGIGIMFVGTEGTVSVSRGYFETWPAELKTEALGSGDALLEETEGNGVAGHCSNWVKCMRTRQRCISDVAVGHRSITIGHLGNIACWLGRSIRWDPDKEEIIGDREASRWLDRPMRAPWHL